MSNRVCSCERHTHTHTSTHTCGVFSSAALTVGTVLVAAGKIDAALLLASKGSAGSGLNLERERRESVRIKEKKREEE